jgi:putative YhbY family RNA-binding protein
MTEAKSIPELPPLQRRSLRAAAHHLNPVVSISQKGLSDTVVKEIDLCLRAHELIKVRLYGIEREQRAELEAELCTMLGCAPVQQIGNLMVLWREHTEDEKSALAARQSAKPKKPLNKKQAAAAAETTAKRRAVRRPAARSRNSS